MSTNCHFCGKHIKPSKQNRNKRYCDDRCKQNAYRWRKRYQDNPELSEKEVEERQERWRKTSLPGPIIEELMTLWYEHGGAAITIAERIMVLYQLYMLDVFEEKTNAYVRRVCGKNKEP